MTKSFTILLTVVTIAVLLFACEKKDVECTSNAAKKSDYLQLPEDFNLCNPSMADLRILSLGFERLPIDAFGKVDFAKKTVIVMGSEGTGIAQLLEKQCDTIVSIPTCGKIDSLNVSVAAGVLLYELYRRKN